MNESLNGRLMKAGLQFVLTQLVTLSSLVAPGVSNCSDQVKPARWLTFDGPDSIVSIRLVVGSQWQSNSEYFLPATGHGHVRRGMSLSKSASFDSLIFSPDSLQSLLNIFYETGFFQSADSYTMLGRIIRTPQGWWDVDVETWHDVPVSTLTVTLGDYSKVVSFSHGVAPKYLLALGDSVVAFADRVVVTKATK
jgi:hypothetical protein